MPATENKHLSDIPVLKLLLILGVVVIHSNINNYIPRDYSNAGLDIVDYIVSLARASVPSFFIISGYLFFYCVKKFTFGIYREKISRRVKTLLLPYILWNIFCASLFLFKVYVLKFPGLGIIENGAVNWIKFLEGFIYIEQDNGYPYAFAFWFIRNLIAFVILAPAVWLVARKWWSVALFFTIEIVFDINFFGIEWFILGAACSLHHISFENRNPNALLVLFGSLFLILTAIGDYCRIPDILSSLVFTLKIAAAFYFFYSVSQRFAHAHQGKAVQYMCSSTFFIYAFHQCFCSINDKFWIHVFGYHTSIGSLAAFLASFISIVTASVLVYALLRKIAPRLLAILTGNRSEPIYRQ